jgi:hypothetical protein
VSTSSDLLGALVPVVEAMEALGVAYRIGGSVASSALGVPRSTLDVDLICDLDAPRVERFVAALDRDYYADADMIRDAIRRRASFNLIHLDTMLKVDVFIVKQGAFDRTSFARHVDRPLADGPDARLFAFRTPEDVILRKLEWFRLGGEVSERQWSDAIGVLRVQQRALDLAYLRHWAREIGVAELLERALGEAGGRGG